MLEIYLKTIEEIRNKVLSLIEKERKTEFNGQNNTESLMRVTESALSETDRLFQVVAALPCEVEALYRCKFLMAEALEDLRQSFEERYSGGPAAGNADGVYWQAKRAGYLLKMQAAEQEVIRLSP